MPVQCVRCTRNLDEDSLFCRFCGAAVRPAAIPPRRLLRVPRDGRVAGVCAGLAVYLDVDVTFVRLAWVILAIVPGAIAGGLLAYLAAWIIIPVDPAGGGASAPTRRLRRSITDVRVAGVCGGIAEYLNADATLVRLAWAVLTIVPGAIVLGVAAYLVAWLILPKAEAPPLPAPPQPSSATA